MFGLNSISFVSILLALPGVPAYAGPGAGLELGGYSLGLFVWVLVALCAVLLWPFYSLVRWLWGLQATVKQAPLNLPEEHLQASPTVGQAGSRPEVQPEGGQANS